jgi:hypothetical protein
MNYLTDNHRSSDQRISCVETYRCRSSTFLVKKKLTAAWPYNTAAWSRLRRVKLDEQSDSEPSRDAGLLTLANTVDHVVLINAVGEPFSATRSALHRCLQRHGISRLLDIESDKPKRQRFKRYPIGFFHIDIAEVQTAEGKLYLFVGIDCTSKFAVTQLVEKADRRRTWEFPRVPAESCALPHSHHPHGQSYPEQSRRGVQFAEQPRNRNTAWSCQMRFDMICEANDIEHRLAKPNHPWTNGQVKRMNRTIKEATVKRFHYESHDQLRTHLAASTAAYNFACRLKTLSGLTP